MARAGRRLGRGTLRFTALLLAATAVAGAIRQLWSALWRERPEAATSQMRERADVQRAAPAPSPVARRVPTPGPRRALGDVTPEREQRSLRPVLEREEPHSDFEVPGEAAPRAVEEAARADALEIRR